MTTFMYQGVSARTYTFELVNMQDPKTIPWSGGVFLFAKSALEPEYIGEAGSLHVELPDHPTWLLLEERLHPTLAYILTTDDAEEREAVVADLVERYRPPLNHRK